MRTSQTPSPDPRATELTKACEGTLLGFLLRGARIGPLAQAHKHAPLFALPPKLAGRTTREMLDAFALGWDDGRIAGELRAALGGVMDPGTCASRAGEPAPTPEELAHAFGLCWLQGYFFRGKDDAVHVDAHALRDSGVFGMRATRPQRRQRVRPLADTYRNLEKADYAEDTRARLPATPPPDAVVMDADTAAFVASVVADVALKCKSRGAASVAALEVRLGQGSIRERAATRGVTKSAVEAALPWVDRRMATIRRRLREVR